MVQMLHFKQKSKYGVEYLFNILTETYFVRSIFSTIDNFTVKI